MPFRIIRALRHYPFQAAGVAVVLLALAWLLRRLADAVTAFAPFLDAVARWFTLTAASIVIVISVWWVVRWLVPAVSTGRWVARRDDDSEHAGGVATWMDIGERAGAWATTGRAHVVRPSIRRVRWWHWRRPDLTEFAVPLVKASWFPVGSTVWSSCEDVTVRIGGPRSGKSASLACHALDAPGALLVTTSRTDLLDTTHETRAAKGRVDVFNPTGLGMLPSSVRWSPLAGCVDLGTAQRRAADLIPASGPGDAERWDNQARGLLAVLMHAAALSGGSMRTVQDWVSPADTIARDQILAALKGSPSARALGAEVRSIYGTNERTLTSITATLLPAIRWLSEGTAAMVGDAPLDHTDFLDVAALVAGGTDSLYLIGREGTCRPLIGALTAEVAHQVRMTAAAMPAGRLDPPMTAVLDEAPLTCGPVPLHDWTSDMGGRGLTLHIAAQSLAQLRDVWGVERANTVLGNTASLIAFGGIKSAEDLERLSTLTGTRLKQLDFDDIRPVPVMTPAEIASLPTSTALVVRTGLRAVVGRAPMIWDRKPSALATFIARGLAHLDWAARLAWSAARRTAAWRPQPRPVPADEPAKTPIGQTTSHAGGTEQPRDAGNFAVLVAGVVCVVGFAFLGCWTATFGGNFDTGYLIMWCCPFLLLLALLSALFMESLPDPRFFTAPFRWIGSLVDYRILTRGTTPRGAGAGDPIRRLGDLGGGSTLRNDEQAPASPIRPTASVALSGSRPGVTPFGRSATSSALGRGQVLHTLRELEADPDLADLTPLSDLFTGPADQATGWPTRRPWIRRRRTLNGSPLTPRASGETPSRTAQQPDGAAKIWGGTPRRGGEFGDA